MSVKLLKEMPLPIRYALFPEICHRISMESLEKNTGLVLSAAYRGRILTEKYEIKTIIDICEDRVLQNITDVDLICFITFNLIKTIVGIKLTEEDMKDVAKTNIDINTLGDKFFFKA